MTRSEAARILYQYSKGSTCQSCFGPKLSYERLCNSCFQAFCEEYTVQEFDHAEIQLAIFMRNRNTQIELEEALENT